MTSFPRRQPAGTAVAQRRGSVRFWLVFAACVWSAVYFWPQVTLALVAAAALLVIGQDVAPVIRRWWARARA